ncbi:hypothetical protein Pcinc_043944 [Petrolisthes cinctipes]|uniref:Protein kinase domain-containing protein n=1 Tax=Petrolisthes cinctipes TaxID=88211 RepID=A0AAE1BI54_PETCI|nr:hypothetical protein Pcinc_043944 [Petrolisthes cinctipes]
MTSEQLRASEAERAHESEFESLLQPYGVLLKEINIIRELGSGSTGLVQVAAYKDKLVCVKKGHKPYSLKSYKMEASVLFKMKGAGGVPLLYAAASDYPFIVMEYVRGRTLDNDITRMYTLGARYVVDLFHKLGSSLNCLHAAGYVHNDLKVDNIIIENTTKAVRIIDMGFSCRIGDVGYPENPNMDGAKKMHMYWSFSHFAPEVFFGLASTPAGDVFSLGRMLEEIRNYMTRKGVIRDWPMGLRLMEANMVHVLPEKRPSLVTIIITCRSYVQSFSRQIEQEVQESLNEQSSAEGSEVLEEEG